MIQKKSPVTTFVLDALPVRLHVSRAKRFQRHVRRAENILYTVSIILTRNSLLSEQAHGNIPAAESQSSAPDGFD